MEKLFLWVSGFGILQAVEFLLQLLQAVAVRPLQAVSQNASE